MSKNISRILIILSIIITNVGCDQVTKQMATEQLKSAPTSSYLDNFFVLTYAINKGAFLSLGSDFNPTLKFWLLTVMPVLVMLGMIGYTFFSKSLTMLQTVAFSFIIGGGISNVYDRIMYDGAVVDFMNMGIGSLRTGIFNFADVSIMIGMGLFLLSSFIKEKEPEEELTKTA